MFRLIVSLEKQTTYVTLTHAEQDELAGKDVAKLACTLPFISVLLRVSV